MQDIEIILRTHASKYPRMQVADAIKLLYQNEFAGGHAVVDAEQSLARLEAEWATIVPDADMPAYEDIGNGLCRVNLAALSARYPNLSPFTLNRFFVYTARTNCGSSEGLLAKLDILRGMAAERTLPFPEHRVTAALERYAEEGYPALHHSEAYRTAYAPAYRVVHKAYARCLALYSAIDRLRAQKPRVCVAIDGMSASGKTTLARQVAKIYTPDCTLLHMDDYFLPQRMRTPKRFTTPGGNVDWERFKEEVTNHLRGDVPLHAKTYDCATDALSAPQTLPISSLVLVEGAYSLHPALRDVYDLKVFLSVDPLEQRRRIRSRNGDVQYWRFVGEWIPLERMYFTACSVRECCDLELHSGSDEQ